MRHTERKGQGTKTLGLGVMVSQKVINCQILGRELLDAENTAPTALETSFQSNSRPQKALVSSFPRVLPGVFGEGGIPSQSLERGKQ